MRYRSLAFIPLMAGFTLVPVFHAQPPEPPKQKELSWDVLLKRYNDLNAATATDHCSGDQIDGLASLFRNIENQVVDEYANIDIGEMNVSAEWHRQIIREKPIVTGTQANTVVDRIMRRLVPKMQNPVYRHQYWVVRSDEINAFAIMGGRLYVHTGILNFVNSEDELAFVLGHELGHNEKRHCVRSVQKMVFLESALGEYGALAANMANVIGAPFGQMDEYEADEYGLRLMRAAGYDPNRALDFFRKLKTRESYDTFEKLTRSHPYSAQRENCLLKIINEG